MYSVSLVSRPPERHRRAVPYRGVPRFKIVQTENRGDVRALLWPMDRVKPSISGLISVLRYAEFVQARRTSQTGPGGIFFPLAGELANKTGEGQRGLNRNLPGTVQFDLYQKDVWRESINFRTDNFMRVSTTE